MPFASSVDPLVLATVFRRRLRLYLATGLLTILSVLLFMLVLRPGGSDHSTVLAGPEATGAPADTVTTSTGTATTKGSTVAKGWATFNGSTTSKGSATTGSTESAGLNGFTTTAGSPESSGAPASSRPVAPATALPRPGAPASLPFVPPSTQATGGAGVDGTTVDGQPTTTAPTVTTTANGGAGTASYEPMRNDRPQFRRYVDVASHQLSLAALTEAASRPDNGTVGDGQFRLACEYSHFGNDDPIVLPGQAGRAHLHMFFGNTAVDAFTSADSLLNRGGSTCNGFELNRSGYWTPALLDGQGNAVVPDSIILYYKTKEPGNVQAMPQGLQIVAGNTGNDGFSAGSRLHWSCGGNGAAYNLTNQIPDCGGDTINATIQFPNCWDGANLGSSDHSSHMAFVAEERPCPASHPVRLPQISFLLYYPGASSVDGWHLSSDRHGGRSMAPGSSLHADWWGGWNDEAMELWIGGCMQAARNCSYGQTGTSRQLAALNKLQIYEGPNYLSLPPGMADQ